MKRKPTTRQLIVMTIRRFWQAYHYAPNMREIMYKLNLNSVEVVRYHLQALRRQGVIEWQEGDERTIRLKEKKAK